MAEEITIVVNGRPERVPAGVTIEALVQRLEGHAGPLVVERNGRFVFPADYAATVVESEDRLELIHPAFGG
jgi:thiamine biosynthesis protein ThiS